MHQGRRSLEVMNPLFLPALVTLVLPAAAFEGTIRFDLKAERESQPLIYSLKGDRARFEIPQAGGPGGASAIVNLSKQEMYMMVPEQRMYLVMSLQQTPGVSSPEPSKATELTFEDTGETAEILGRECRKYLITDRKSTTEVWGAKGMGTFMAQFGGGNPMQGGSIPDWQQELGAQGFFPLRVIGRDSRGQETFRMEATQIEERPLSDDLFAVPEDYQQLDMTDLLRGLAPGMK